LFECSVNGTSESTVNNKLYPKLSAVQLANLWMEKSINLMSSDVIHHRRVLPNSATKLPPFYGTPGVDSRVNNSPPLAPYTPHLSSSMNRSHE